MLLSRSIHDAIPPSPNIYKDSLFICLLDKIMITVMIYYLIIKIKEERSLPPASLDLFCRHLHVKIIAENPVPADFEANKVAVQGSRNLLWIEFPPRKHVIFPWFFFSILLSKLNATRRNTEIPSCVLSFRGFCYSSWNQWRFHIERSEEKTNQRGAKCSPQR